MTSYRRIHSRSKQVALRVGCRAVTEQERADAWLRVAASPQLRLCFPNM